VHRKRGRSTCLPALSSWERRVALTPMAARCHRTNRLAVATSQAVRPKGGPRRTVAFATRRTENFVFNDFCRQRPPSAFVFEILLRESGLVRRAGSQALSAFASRTREAESRSVHFPRTTHGYSRAEP
jgi:hypothetical protein